MNLPKVIADLVAAQNTFDSASYANCFSENATVFDEGKNHQGKKEIQTWIEKANKEYQAVMVPVSYEETGKLSMLSARISGTFPGSPLVLKYHFEIDGGLIESLRISG